MKKVVQQKTKKQPTMTDEKLNKIKTTERQRMVKGTVVSFLQKYLNTRTVLVYFDNFPTENK